MLGGMIRVNQNNQTFFEGMWSTDLTDGLSVDMVDDASKFAVYPNPTHNDVFISSTDKELIKSYSIYNTLGKIVKTGTLENNKISLNDLSSGIYFIKLKTNENYLVTKKIIKL